MKNKWTILYYILYGFTGIGFVIWFLLLGTICAGPTKPNPAMNQITEYNCHGTVVFLEPYKNFLLHWTIPILLVAVIVGNIAKDKSPSK
jgi:hypothetical protein